jgi:Tfp pilus assembly protein PilP
MTRFALTLLAAIALVGGGCGGDEGGGGGGGDEKAKEAAKKKKDDAKKKAAANKSKKKKLDVITHVPTLEARVPCRQGTQLRHKLKDRDFNSAENRNPFYSPFLPPEGETTTTVVGSTGPVPIVKPTKECDAEDLIASSFALRDLALIGIIRRGNQRFALFRDSKGVGHIVSRGKCLGREKARVIEIAEELVDVEIIPEETATPTPGGDNLLPQRVSIPLYPEAIVSDTVDDVADAPAEPPPATEPAPTTPSTTPAPPPTTP